MDSRLFYQVLPVFILEDMRWDKKDIGCMILLACLTVFLWIIGYEMAFGD